MCGIFSIINLKGNHSTLSLKKGTEIIAHRGPDDEGYLLWDGGPSIDLFAGKATSDASRAFHHFADLPGEYPWKVGLGHRRLSIIDLSPRGHQPMVDPGSGLALIFNGEIYNYKELRPELETMGYRFETETDTEVLLKAWEAWGTEAPIILTACLLLSC